VQWDEPHLPVIWLIEEAQLAHRHVNWKDPPDS